MKLCIEPGFSGATHAYGVLRKHGLTRCADRILGDVHAFGDCLTRQLLRETLCPFGPRFQSHSFAGPFWDDNGKRTDGTE